MSSPTDLPRTTDSRVRVFRWMSAGLLIGAGVSLIVLAARWRGIEATLAAHAIHVVTGQAAVANPGRHLLILYKSNSVQSTFVLTSECSVAYLLAALLIGAAPLMVLRKLSPVRTGIAIAVSAVILVLVNQIRLTAIGATVSEWGRDPGLTIAHTYLGSLVTIVGTCGAGVAFAAVMLGHRRGPSPSSR